MFKQKPRLRARMSIALNGQTQWAYLIPNNLLTINNASIEKSPYKSRNSDGFTNEDDYAKRLALGFALGVIKIPTLGKGVVPKETKGIILMPTELTEPNNTPELLQQAEDKGLLLIGKSRIYADYSVCWQEFELTRLTNEFIQANYTVVDNEQFNIIPAMVAGLGAFNTLFHDHFSNRGGQRSTSGTPKGNVLAPFLELIVSEEDVRKNLEIIYPHKTSMPNIMTTRSGVLFDLSDANRDKFKETLGGILDKMKAAPDAEIDLDDMLEVEMLARVVDTEGSYKNRRADNLAKKIKGAITDLAKDPNFKAWELDISNYKETVFIGINASGEVDILPSLKALGDRELNHMRYTTESDVTYVCAIQVGRGVVSHSLNLLTSDLDCLKKVFESSRCEVVELNTKDGVEAMLEKLSSPRAKLALVDGVHAELIHIKSKLPLINEDSEWVDFSHILGMDIIDNLQNRIDNIIGNHDLEEF